MAIRRNKLDLFLNHEKVLQLINVADHAFIWDFNTSLGNTMEDRCRSMLTTIAAATARICSQGVSGHFCVIVSPETALIWETLGLMDREILETSDHLLTEFQAGVNYFGLMKNRWAVYCDPQLTPARMLLGTNLSENRPACLARINILNFIF